MQQGCHKQHNIARGKHAAQCSPAAHSRVCASLKALPSIAPVHGSSLIVSGSKALYTHSFDTKEEASPSSVVQAHRMQRGVSMHMVTGMFPEFTWSSCRDIPLESAERPAVYSSDAFKG